MAHQLSTKAVSRLIDVLLANGYPAIEKVAQILRVSPRTLQRLLNEEGISYSDLVEGCRCRAACDAVEQAPAAIQDISAKLGYANASSFARAFRRWTGSTPRVWRKQSLQQQAGRSSQSVSRAGLTLQVAAKTHRLS